VFMFWTGPTVCSATITAADARKFAAWIKRKPIVWDNYPVNDMFPWRPLMAPVKGRSADLASEVAGLMSNPMKQWEASRIPLSTIADYLRDPTSYDPTKALGSALNQYDETDRPWVRNVLDLYGTTFLGAGGYPPKPNPPDRTQAAKLLETYRHVKQNVPNSSACQALWNDISETIQNDIATLEHNQAVGGGNGG
jgi:hypothetical protein